MSNYQSFVTSLHQQSTLSPQFLCELQSKLKISKIHNPTSLSAGEINQAFEIDSGNQSLIVRINREPNSSFDQEVWAISQCRQNNIPAPEILLTGTFKENNNIFSYCVQTKASGIQLDRGGFDFHTLPKDQLPKIIASAGQTLFKIHQIKTQGFGHLNGQGQGKRKTLSEQLTKNLMLADRYQQIFHKHQINDALLSNVLSFIEKEIVTIPEIQPVLNHGDYGPKHLFFENQNITGVIDWGEVSGNTPLVDIAEWDYWYNDEFPTQWLLLGYSDKNVSKQVDSSLFKIIQLNKALENINWYDNSNYKKGVVEAKQKLELIQIH